MTVTLDEALAGVRHFVGEHGRLAMDSELLADEADRVLSAVWEALGPVPVLLWGDAVRDARAARPELAARDPELVLAVPPDAILYPPLLGQQRLVERMIALGVPDVILDGERARLAELAAEVQPAPQWDRVFVLADQRAAWPGYLHRGALALDTARHVLAGWTLDDEPRRLLEDAAHVLATGRVARELALRDRLSARTFEIEGAPNAVLRAALQAHDRITQNPARDDQTELEYLAEHAWSGSAVEITTWWIERVASISTSSRALPGS